MKTGFSSGHITVIGEVRGIDCRYEDSSIYSYVTLFVSEITSGPGTLKGTEIVIKHEGGDVGGVVLWRSDQPHFAVGDLVEVHLRLDDVFYIVIGGEGKTNVESLLFESRTTAGYKLFWYKPGEGWSTATSRPGPDWYGPLRWGDSQIPVPYWIDTRNLPSGISESAFIGSVTSSYQTWEDDPGSYIDHAYQGTRMDVEPGDYDEINVVGWRYIDGGGGTLGVANLWGVYIPGDYDSFRLNDADMTLDTSESWSAAPICPADKFDVQNVATHEAGHITGLADLYDVEDSELTMYGYSSLGETKRRTLEWGDQEGVQTLYPIVQSQVTFKTNPTSFVATPGSITVGGTTYTHDQSDPFPDGDYTATANAPLDYSFHHWEYSGIYVPNTETNPTTIEVNGDGWLKAFFSAKITFHTDPPEIGSVTYEGDTFVHGELYMEINLPPDHGNQMTITANAPPEYQFTHWETTGAVSVSDPSSSTTIVTVNGPGDLTVYFTPRWPMTPSNLPPGPSNPTTLPTGPSNPSID